MLRGKLTNSRYVHAIDNAYNLPGNLVFELPTQDRAMLATLSEFNRAEPGAAFDFAALVKEFRRSGIVEIDRLWTKRCALYQQQCSIGDRLAAVAERLGPEKTANMIYNLLVRLPFALAHSDLLNNEHASHVILRSLWSMKFGNAYAKKDCTAYLKKSFDRIVDVIIWIKQRAAPWDRNLSIVLTIGEAFVFEPNFFHIPQSGILAVRHLYELLDDTLDPLDFDQSGWFELYRYCKALRLSKKESRLDGLGENMDQLVESYRMILNRVSDEKIAEALFSNDPIYFRCTAKTLFATEGVTAFYKLLAAWKLRPISVSRSQNEDPQSRLHVRLESDMKMTWGELYRMIDWLHEQPLQLTDQQRAALIRSMARNDGFPHAGFVWQSFAICRNGGYPETYEALKGMRAAEEHASPAAYREILEEQKARRLDLDFVRFANVALGRLRPT